MKPTFTRRDFLAAGATIAGGLAIGGTGCSPEPTTPLPLSPDSPPATTAIADRDLQDPPVIRGVGGVLAATIPVATDPALIAGSVRLAPVTYNNTYPGPTLRVEAGDLVDLTVRNREADRHARRRRERGRDGSRPGAARSGGASRSLGGDGITRAHDHPRSG